MLPGTPGKNQQTNTSRPSKVSTHHQRITPQRNCNNCIKMTQDGITNARINRKNLAISRWHGMNAFTACLLHVVVRPITPTRPSATANDNKNEKKCLQTTELPGKMSTWFTHLLHYSKQHSAATQAGIYLPGTPPFYLRPPASKVVALYSIRYRYT